MRKKPLKYMPSVYANSENAIAVSKLPHPEGPVSQYLQLFKSAPSGAVFSIRSTIFGRYCVL